MVCFVACHAQHDAGSRVSNRSIHFSALHVLAHAPNAHRSAALLRWFLNMLCVVVLTGYIMLGSFIAWCVVISGVSRRSGQRGGEGTPGGSGAAAGVHFWIVLTALLHPLPS